GIEHVGVADAHAAAAAAAHRDAEHAAVREATIATARALGARDGLVRAETRRAEAQRSVGRAALEDRVGDRHHARADADARVRDLDVAAVRAARQEREPDR